MQCLRSICISGLHGGNGVNERLWQWAERGAQAQRGGGGVCGGAKTSAIQPSPEPVSRNFSSRLAALLLPLSLSHPPLLDLLPILPSLPCVFEGAEPKKRHSAPGSVAAEKLCSFQPDRQSTHLLCRLERAKPPLFCLVTVEMMGRH